LNVLGPFGGEQDGRGQTSGWPVTRRRSPGRWLSSRTTAPAAHASRR